MTSAVATSAPARRRSLRARVREASRLDKIRWLMVYSVDVMMLVLGLGFVQLLAMADIDGYPTPLAVAAALLLAVLYALATRPFRILVAGRPTPVRLLVIAGVITLCLTALGLIVTFPVYLAMLAPFVRKRVILLLGGLFLAGATAMLMIYAPEAAPDVALLLVIAEAVLVGSVLANLWLWRIAVEAHDGEEAKAKLAVSEERLRLARELNALLGQSLSDISVKSYQAATLADEGEGEAAARQMFEVRDRARVSLKEVRAAVQDYRALSLDETLASVRAVLEAAGVECAVRVRAAGLPAAGLTLLAAAVREGTTVILRHGTAKRCVISIEKGVLEMTNDGTREPGDLDALAERAAAAGAALTPLPGPGAGFILKVAA
ncbi:histidine kinase [Nonomuraea sp. NPDC050310]|uniref:sensor histidine kinase n=1 Tax=unclassified Nonomuraea TaxID=2593643 RepID=UPI0033E4FA5F